MNWPMAFFLSSLAFGGTAIWITGNGQPIVQIREVAKRVGDAIPVDQVSEIIDGVQVDCVRLASGKVRSSITAPGIPKAKINLRCLIGEDGQIRMFTRKENRNEGVDVRGSRR